jgi:Holliday junction resolvase-like predicted endonuclease
MARDRKKSETAGRTAEIVALWYLRLKGYRLLVHRYKSHAGEVDLIMRKGDTTAFIEVKNRATIDGAITSVTTRRRCATTKRRRTTITIRNITVIIRGVVYWVSIFTAIITWGVISSA